MNKSRLLTIIFGTIIMTFSSYQPANAYSNDAAPAATAPAPAESGKSGQVMDESKTIEQNIAQSPNFSTLSKALAAAGLNASLSGSGPLIVFAPDDGAFAKIPAEKLADLMKPENKDKLSKVLSYHVSTGNLSLKDLEKLGATGNEIPLRTLAGGMISVKKISDAGSEKWAVTDESGNVAMITQADQKTSNGKIYVIDAVLMPKM